MPETENISRQELSRLMRSIAREVAYNVLDEHLEDYVHTAKARSDRAGD